ncbi:hypothetical protein RDI58_013155 [Solanum bulbocastanum]|uniref:Uncharacterized protein n=1 Tax=Solanum bulbocastanum TaxID=147425 RepID=A0AAN8YEZ3_SOLBU
MDKQPYRSSVMWIHHMFKIKVKAFVKHESRYKYDVEGMHKVQGWRNALTAAADLKEIFVMGDVGWFGNGSRVIVTTRNR